MKISYNSYYVELSEKSDNNADRLYWMTSAVRHKYRPHVFRTEPKWHEWKKRRHERVFNRAYEKAFGINHRSIYDKFWSSKHRTAYWTEINRGQYPNEDAGGYQVRCLNALLAGDVTEPGESYDDMYRRLISEEKKVS